jgi:hypothetical protein
LMRHKGFGLMLKNVQDGAAVHNQQSILSLEWM